MFTILLICKLYRIVKNETNNITPGSEVIPCLPNKKVTKNYTLVTPR